MQVSRVHVVLLRTRNPQNLGAAARAMKNCGLSRLTLVDPYTDDLVTARRVAVHSEELLEAPRIVSRLEEAVQDAVWVVGTSSRSLPGRRQLTPRQVAEEAAQRSEQGEVALVFGDEESGMSNADLVLCHDLSTIPAAPQMPSFNLAQSVVLYAYELFLASGIAPPPLPQRASERELQPLEEALRRVLDESRFADLDRPRHGVKDLAQTLRRAGLTPDEARLWGAALQRIQAALKGR